MDIRKLSLRSLVFAAAAAVPVATASAAMATPAPLLGFNPAPALITYHHPQHAPAKCKPFSTKNKFSYGPNKPGQDWCITWCAPKETGRWVQKGPKKWEWVVTAYQGRHPVPVCKSVVKTRRRRSGTGTRLRRTSTRLRRTLTPSRRSTTRSLASTGHTPAGRHSDCLTGELSDLSHTGPRYPAR